MHYKSSTRYVSMSKTLVDMQSDPESIGALLSSQGDHGSWWIEAAHRELRQELVNGRIDDGARIGRLIGTVLKARQASGVEDPSDPASHLGALKEVVNGIGAILDRDYQMGMAVLDKVGQSPSCGRSLRWVALYWMAKAASDTGVLQEAVLVGRRALGIAEELDPQAKSTTLCTLGAIEFLADEKRVALAHLSEATRIFYRAEDRKGMAASWLTRAQMQSALGETALAVGAAALARQSYPEWEQPAIFLARQAVIAGDYDQAAWVLKLFAEDTPPPPEVEREMRLVEVARTDPGASDALREYARLRDLPPTDETVARFEALVEKAPTFLQIREMLAWMLFKRGKDEKAALHFEALAIEDLDPELHASVLLGLGCLANRRAQHRQLGARLHAASSAGRSAHATGGLATVPTAQDLDKPNPRPALVRVATSETLDAKPDSKEEASHAKEFEGQTDAHLKTPNIASTNLVHAPSPKPAGAPPDQAAFAGSLKLLNVQELLDFLRASRRSGTLVVTSSSGIGAVQMHRGMITGGKSPTCRNMGALLLASGALTDAQIEEANQVQKTDARGRLFGQILIDLGAVTKEQIQAALGEQVRNALLEMVQWTTGQFAFDPVHRDQADESDTSIMLDTQGVLLDVLRMLDEQTHAGD